MFIDVYPLKIIQNNAPNFGKAFSSTDTGEAYGKKELGAGTNAVAYVTGHPQPPYLTARFEILPNHVNVDWGFAIQTERPEARKNKVDDRTYPTTRLEGWETYHIHLDVMTNEVITGKCTLKYKTTFENKTYENAVSFPIRGKNPKDADVEAYIRQVAPPILRDLAVDIAKIESMQPVGKDPATGKPLWYIFNQYNAGTFTNRTTKKVTPVGTLNISSDTNGVGIAQITSGPKPTAVAHNWKRNVQRQGEILADKHTVHTNFMGYFKNTYSNHPSWTAPPAAYTTNGITMAHYEWGSMMLYNGADEECIPLSTLKKVDGKLIKVRSPMVFTNGTWILYDNREHYLRTMTTDMMLMKTNGIVIKE